MFAPIIFEMSKQTIRVFIVSAYVGWIPIRFYLRDILEVCVITFGGCTYIGFIVQR